MPDTELTSKELLPCRKCGASDFDMWDGKGTQAELVCNECGQFESIQVCDLFEYDERFGGNFDFNMETLSYPKHAIDRCKVALIEEWNKRAESKQLTTTQQALDAANEEIKATKALYAIKNLCDEDLTEENKALQQALDSAVEALEIVPTKAYNAGVMAGMLKDKADHCFNDELKQDYLKRVEFYQDEFKELHKAALAAIKG